VHPGLNYASYEEEITDTAHKIRFTSAVAPSRGWRSMRLDWEQTSTQFEAFR
jgi:hypothetical protein